MDCLFGYQGTIVQVCGHQYWKPTCLWSRRLTALLIVSFGYTALDACDVGTRYLHGCLIKYYSRVTHLSPTTGYEEAGDGSVTLEII